MTLSARTSVRPSFSLALLALGLFATGRPSLAQTDTAQPAPAHASTPSENQANWSVKTFHLANATQNNETLGVQVSLRNMLDANDRVYANTESNDILVYASPEQLALAGRLISELDRPKRAYRLTYTIAESENGKRLGIQHFNVVAVTGQRVQMKQGDKIPVMTGSFSTDKSREETQFTYLDVGMNIDSTLDTFAGGLRLRSKVEQSSVASNSQATGKLADEPVVRQSVIEGSSVIVPGKPLTIGSIDMVGSTRHIDIEVMAEPLS